jgi:hypothetical protein
VGAGRVDRAMAIQSATASTRTVVIAPRVMDGDSSSKRFQPEEVPLIMCSVINRVARGCALSFAIALMWGCHRQHAENPTALAPDLGGGVSAEQESPLLARGDKVLVMIDGERKGTGTYNGQSVVLDPPLDTLSPSRIDSTRVRVGPAARELYGVSYRMVGVLLVWLHPL